jgi:hypothetical protein
LTFEKNETDREAASAIGGLFHCQLPIADCQLALLTETIRKPL